MLEFQVEMIQENSIQFLFFKFVDPTFVTEYRKVQLASPMVNDLMSLLELSQVSITVQSQQNRPISTPLKTYISPYIRFIIRRLAHTLITPLCIVRNSYLVTSKLYIWPSYITYSFNNVRAQNKSQETFSNLIKKIIAWWRYLMRRMKINKDGYK